MKQMVTICDYCGLLGMHPTKLFWTSAVGKPAYYVSTLTEDAISHLKHPPQSYDLEYCRLCEKDYCNNTVKCRLLHRSEHLQKESK